MKLIKLVGHPVVLIILYLLLIIEGDQFGGFFLLYLVLSVPHFILYSVVASAGLLFVILAFNLENKYWKLVPIFYVLGYALMITSLVLFFAKGNKWKTFELTVPLISFILFGISSICYLINIVLFPSRKRIENLYK